MPFRDDRYVCRTGNTKDTKVIVDDTVGPIRVNRLVYTPGEVLPEGAVIDECPDVGHDMRQAIIDHDDDWVQAYWNAVKHGVAILDFSIAENQDLLIRTIDYGYFNIAAEMMDHSTINIVNISTAEGLNSLIMACLLNDGNTVREVLNFNGVDINQEYHGRTALDIAQEFGNADIINEIMTYPAAPGALVVDDGHHMELAGAFGAPSEGIAAGAA